MWLDVLALLILGVFVGMGAHRGGLASALGLITLGASYAAAIVAAIRFGPVLARQLDMAEFLGLPIVSTMAFIVVYALLSVVSRVLQRRSEERRGGQPRSPRDRFLGGLVGFARGGLVVMLLAWLALWVDALGVTGSFENLPSLDGSIAASVTGDAVEAGVAASLSDTGAAGPFMAHLAARPGAALRDLQELVDDPRVERLRQDPMFWTYLENGAVDSALNQRSFLRLTYDSDFRQRLAGLGLIPPEAAVGPVEFRRAITPVMKDVGARLQGIRNDPAMQELMEDPEVTALIQNGDTLALVAHPGFRQLVSRVASNSNGSNGPN
jgi:hypothetical protein